MSRKQSIRKLLDESPTGLLWSEGGVPVSVSIEGTAYWIGSGDPVMPHYKLYSLPPHLRKYEQKNRADSNKSYTQAICDHNAKLWKEADGLRKENSSLMSKITELQGCLDSATTRADLAESVCKELSKQRYELEAALLESKNYRKEDKYTIGYQRNEIKRLRKRLSVSSDPQLPEGATLCSTPPTTDRWVNVYRLDHTHLGKFFYGSIGQHWFAQGKDYFTTHYFGASHYWMEL